MHLLPDSLPGLMARFVAEYRVNHLVEGLPGVNGNRPECAPALLISRQAAAYVLARVPGTAPLVVLARIQPCQHGGLVDLQQGHLDEAVGQLQLIVRTAAE